MEPLVTSRQKHDSVTREIGTAARHSAVYGLGAIAVKVIGFLMLPVYTHYLSPTDYGVLELLDLSMSLLGMFLNMGMTAALLRYYGNASSPEAKKTVVSTSLLFVTVTGVAMFLLAVGLVRPVSTLVFGPQIPSRYMLLSVCSFILGYIANLPRAYLRALEASTAFVALDTLGLFGMLLMNIFFVVVLKMGLSGILWSALLTNVAWIAASAWVFDRVGFRFNGPILRQMLGFGLPLIFSNMALFALNFSDRFFLKHFQSLEVVGIYSVGYKFGYMMNFLLVQPFLGMWQARMYVIHGRPDHPEIYGRLFVLYSVCLIYTGMAISMFSPEMIRLMVSPEFSSSEHVIPLVVLAYIFYGMGSYAQLGMYLKLRTKAIGVISAAAGILNLGLNYWLIGQFGMMGAALATALSFGAIAVAGYYYSQRLLPLPLGASRVTVALALATGLYLVGAFLKLGMVELVIVKCVLLIVFPIVLYKGHILLPPEVDTVLSMIDSCREKLAGFVPWVAAKAPNS